MYGTRHGCNEVRETAERLGMHPPNASCSFRSCQVNGAMAFLESGAEADVARVIDGTDSYLNREAEFGYRRFITP